MAHVSLNFGSMMLFMGASILFSFLLLASFMLNPPGQPAALVALGDQLDQLEWTLDLLENTNSGMLGRERPLNLDGNIRQARAHISRVRGTLSRFENQSSLSTTFLWPFRSLEAFRLAHNAHGLVLNIRRLPVALPPNIESQLAQIRRDLKVVRKKLPEHTEEILGRIIDVEHRIEDLQDWVRVEHMRNTAPDRTSESGSNVGVRGSERESEPETEEMPEVMPIPDFGEGS
ncbi:Hypothetical protein D9617_14g075970 [Elsinoe fawcettii]|nr:Hypothetical protein D9617_14g075970 [Elsinoe fawcettii]